MRYPAASLLLALVLQALAGCGQTGPLYHPQPEADTATADRQAAE